MIAYIIVMIIAIIALGSYALFTVFNSNEKPLKWIMVIVSFFAAKYIFSELLQVLNTLN
jgi:type IV secretory pathway VirB2 component (pilin)